jgi:hypothetical protein
VDCGDFPEVAVCNYSKSIDKNGVEKFSVLQYRNECSYCRFYFGKEQMDLGGTTVIDLGYEPKECSQGMYKK